MINLTNYQLTIMIEYIIEWLQPSLCLSLEEPFHYGASVVVVVQMIPINFQLGVPRRIEYLSR